MPDKFPSEGKITVVCASIGRPSLLTLIPSLHSASCISKILLILPPGIHINPSITSLETYYPKLLLLRSHQKGQVFQRVFGFRLVDTSSVLVVDDDINVSPSTIESLFRLHSTLGFDVALAPRILLETSKYHSIQHSRKGLLILHLAHHLHSLLTFSFESRLLSLSYFPSPPSTNLKYLLPRQWLPGGVILIPTKHLPLESYYIWDGKAYGEDLFLSRHLTKTGCTLYQASDLFAFTPLPPPSRSFNLRQFIRFLSLQLDTSTSPFQAIITVIATPLFLLCTLVILALSYLASTLIL